eukprot:1746525-Pleurochrysis_carterae.AAC.3
MLAACARPFPVQPKLALPFPCSPFLLCRSEYHFTRCLCEPLFRAFALLAGAREGEAAGCGLGGCGEAQARPADLGAITTETNAGDEAEIALRRRRDEGEMKRRWSGGGVEVEPDGWEIEGRCDGDAIWTLRVHAIENTRRSRFGGYRSGWVWRCLVAGAAATP